MINMRISRTDKTSNLSHNGDNNGFTWSADKNSSF